MRNIKKGFTLIELLAAVLVLGVLSAIAMPQYLKSVTRARAMEGMVMLPALYDSVLRWQAENPDKDWVESGSFNLLDVGSKGTISGAGTASKLCTPNFVYTFKTNKTGNIFFATFRHKGKYRGNFFAYSAQYKDGGEVVPGDAQVYCAPVRQNAHNPEEVIQNICEMMGYKVDESGSIIGIPLAILNEMLDHHQHVDEAFYNC